MSKERSTYVNEQNKLKIIASLQAGNPVKETKKRYHLKKIEIESVIKELLNENSPHYNPGLHAEIIKREEELERDYQKRIELALTDIEKNGLSQKEAKEKQDVDFYDVTLAIRKLEKINRERYQRICDVLELLEEKERKLDEKIIEMILNRDSYEQMEKEGITRSRRKKAIKNLENSSDSEKYLEVQMALKECAKVNRKKENEKIDQMFMTNMFRNAHLMIYNGIPIEDYALQIGVVPTTLKERLEKIKNEELSEKLLPFLEKFTRKFSKRKAKNKIKNYPQNIQRDIILTALTFRVNMESMVKIFKIDIDDLWELYYKSSSKYSSALKFLNRETRNEADINTKRAFSKAVLYWQVRNKLAKKLNDAIARKEEINEAMKTAINEEKERLEKEKQNVEDEIGKVKKELQEHHKEIDDTLALEAAAKNGYRTQEEKDRLARLRLKYYYSKKIFYELTGVDSHSIANYEENLAQRNPIYDEQLDLMNAVWQEKNKEKRKAFYEDTNVLYPSVQKERETKKNLDYFNFTIDRNSLSLEEMDEMTRGGGTR